MQILKRSNIMFSICKASKSYFLSVILTDYLSVLKCIVNNCFLYKIFLHCCFAKLLYELENKFTKIQAIIKTT